MPVILFTRTLASTVLKVAPDSTFRSERLFVQTSLAPLPPMKVPARTSISEPEPRAKVPAPFQTISPAPVLRSVPAPLKVVVAALRLPLATFSSRIAPLLTACAAEAYVFW